MEILRFLLSFFLNQSGGEKFKPVLEHLENSIENNSFDLKKFLGSLTPETVAPIFKDFMSASSSSTPVYEKLTPIISVADEDVIETLNCYFEDITV